MKLFLALVVFSSLVAVICCIKPDPPFTEEQQECIRQESLERREAIVEDCDLGEGWSSLKNITDLFTYISCDISECVVNFGEVADVCDRNDVTQQINEECESGSLGRHEVSMVVLVGMLAAISAMF